MGRRLRLRHVLFLSSQSIFIILFLFTSFSPANGKTNLTRPSFTPINRDLYHNSDSLMEEISALVHRHPHKLYMETIGSQNKGYRAEMTVVTYCLNRTEIDDKLKYRVLLSFGQHGRELITSELALKILSILSEEQFLPNMDPIILKGTLERLVIKVVPMENLNGRKLVEEGDLLRGVDLNRNWSVDWDKKEKDYDPYEENPRAAPFSEPETQMMRKLCLSFEPHIWVNVHSGMEGLPKIPPTVCSDDILLFFKLYDPLKEELSYVGRLYVKASGMPVEILAKINGLAGFALDEDIQLFEEIKFEPIVMCELVDKMLTFRGSQLGDGDIVCFQKSPQSESSRQCEHPDVPSFLEYVHHHQIKPEHHSKYGCQISSEPKPTERGQGTNSAGSTTQIHSANVPDGKVRFLAYWVSSEAALLLERIHSTHKDTFTKFPMKGQKLPTVLLESFASFVESMSTTKVNEVQDDVLRQATLSIEDFEQVGLELSWLKKRLEEAKKANKRAESLIYVDLCETALKVGRAKVRDLEEGLVKAKAELEDWSTDLPNSLAANDYLLLDVV